nr:MAG TPA: hypothetical protein [Caudoviricetes sp.]DAU05897.1 MAG TPA: hypothetical protein [Caudoviricetes sp.]
MGMPQSQQTACCALHWLKNVALSFSNWRVVLRVRPAMNRLPFGVLCSFDLQNYRYYVTIVISANERR